MDIESKKERRRYDATAERHAKRFGLDKDLTSNQIAEKRRKAGLGAEHAAQAKLRAPPLVVPTRFDQKHEASANESATRLRGVRPERPLAPISVSEARAASAVTTGAGSTSGISTTHLTVDWHVLGQVPSVRVRGSAAHTGERSGAGPTTPHPNGVYDFADSVAA